MCLLGFLWVYICVVAPVCLELFLTRVLRVLVRVCVCVCACAFSFSVSVCACCVSLSLALVFASLFEVICVCACDFCLLCPLAPVLPKSLAEGWNTRPISVYFRPFATVLLFWCGRLASESICHLWLKPYALLGATSGRKTSALC